MKVRRCSSFTHHTVSLDVRGERVDAVAQALLHDVHVAADLPAVVRLAHVAPVVVPAGAFSRQLQERLVFRGAQDLCGTGRSGSVSFFGSGHG